MRRIFLHRPTRHFACKISLRQSDGDVAPDCGIVARRHLSRTGMRGKHGGDVKFSVQHLLRDADSLEELRMNNTERSGREPPKLDGALHAWMKKRVLARNDCRVEPDRAEELLE